jgi:hypothetical protein
MLLLKAFKELGIGIKSMDKEEYKRKRIIEGELIKR